MAKTTAYLQSLLDNAKDGDQYQWLEAYTGDPYHYLQIKHNCGNVFELRPVDFEQGKRCDIHAHCGENIW